MARRATGGTPATEALAQAGVWFALHPYQHDPSGDQSYGAEAAAKLALAPDRVFKTLLTQVDHRPAVGVVSVEGRLDLKALAAALGGKKASLAPPDLAERVTGYVVGGISPLGQRTALPIVIDDSIYDHETVFVSAGRRGMDVEVVPADLVRVTGALVARIRRE